MTERPSVAEVEPHPATDYVLGDLTIRTRQALVLRGDQEVALPRLSFDLLLVLVRAAPDLVTIDEMMSRVWPGLVVSPETVSQRIKLLRAALSDDSRRPRYIAGVRGRGYRIVAPVEVVSGGSAAATTATPLAATRATMPPAQSRGRTLSVPMRVFWAGLGAIALAVIALVVWWPRTRDDVPASSLPSKSVAVLPFENLGHTPQDAALAFGVPETLLHKLAAVKDLTVIARRSSFTFVGGDTDIRDIGRRLNARYVVEGSLQSDRTRLRITAQLIDATDGSHVWSMQFDRKPEDIFAIQDEIASKVAQAMQLTVAGSPGGAGTRNFDAYLAYSQGRARLATGRVADAKLAIDDLERAIRVDPAFAAAHASLARAHLYVAREDVTDDRRSNVEKATARARELLVRARELDETNAEPYFELGGLDAGPQAEAEIRRGLELNPNSAIGYQRLYEVLWMQGKRNESIGAIDRARELDPLELSYDNIKAQLMLWQRSDAQQAEELSLKVLARNPSSEQALERLGEINWCCRAQYASGAKYLEESLRNDPAREFGRRMLMKAYLDMNDPAEAEAVARSADHPVAARMVTILMYRRDWRAAADLAYDEVQRDTGEAIDSNARALAVRMDAIHSGDYEKARRYLEQKSQVTWNPDGTPELNGHYFFDFAAVLPDVLEKLGERDRAVRLSEALLARFDYEAHQLGRGDMWYLIWTARLLALLHRDEQALATLERCFDTGFSHDSWFWIDVEPMFDGLRSQPRFKALVARSDGLAAEQRSELDRMRAAQLIPWRTRPQEAAASSHSR